MQREYQYVVARIQEALAKDPRIGVLDLKVTVTDHTIYVDGEVETDEQRRAIEELVTQAVPEYQIHNETAVRNVSPATGDEAIDD